MRYNHNTAVIHDYRNSMSPARQYLPLAYLEHMPTKAITMQQMYTLKCDMDWNNLYDYGYPNEHQFAQTVFPYLANEVGHDQIYRYTLSQEEIQDGRQGVS